MRLQLCRGDSDNRVANENRRVDLGNQSYFVFIIGQFAKRLAEAAEFWLNWRLRLELE